MKERIIIVFVAVIIGLVLTTVGYLLYQSFQNPSQNNSEPQQQTVNQPTATPSPDMSFYVTITEPKNESITNKRTITINGTTNPGNTVIVSSNQDDVIAEPKEDGTFSTSITINAGSNIIIARAMNSEGDIVEYSSVVTFVAEDF